MPGGRPLLFSYGGGHAHIVVALARELDRRGIGYDLLGLTTAHQAFVRAGLRPMNISALTEGAPDAGLMQKGAKLAPLPDHPDITAAQTQAYFAIGLEDLANRYGEAEAEALIERLGRKAFEPVTAFRRLLARLGSSVVVTTTSPRAELAGIKAAKSLGIPSLAVGDMYLVAEQEWILGGTYSDHLVVMSDDVGEMLAATGKLTSRLHVLGNPAFDALAPAAGDQERRRDLRERLGVGDRKCILWPLGGASDEVAGQRLLPANEVASMLEELCEDDASFCYLLRPHPNWPVAPIGLKHGMVESALSLEDALLVADLVCVEASTVGLQAVLRGLPVICLSFADYVIYPRYGWAAKADTLAELKSMVLRREYFAPPPSVAGYVGGAASRVCDLLLDVAS